MNDRDDTTARRTGVVRCAIYTRKSSEEGLEQEFNSLDAQRESCEAYIKSQKHAGWRTLSETYDDGGVSGGTMERPALQRLLTDIGLGRIDTVVVYKVDRLTRSLSDFAKIVDAFDAKGVSFVSVTQQFNTTSSMGRLTLNMLLSFAQFEREVTGERIRDKIAASKAKGMWMGGNVPLGYDVVDRKLVVNPDEAEKVRHIFRRYASLGSVNILARELNREKILSKYRVSGAGNARGGVAFSRGSLYLILQNRIYLGEIKHKDKTYSGEHDAIVDLDLWNRVAHKLSENRVERQTGVNVKTPALLMRLIHDEADLPMTPTHAIKKGRRYRYYVSRSLITGARSHAPTGRRLSAGDIESLVLDRLSRFLGSANEVLEAIAAHIPSDASRQNIIERAAAFATTISSIPAAEQRIFVTALVARVAVIQDRIDIHVNRKRLYDYLSEPDSIAKGFKGFAPLDDCLQLTTNTLLRASGRGARLIVQASRSTAPDDSLVRLLVRAFAWREKLDAGGGTSIKALARESGSSGSYATRVMRLTFLAPDIIRDILEGRHPPLLTAAKLVANTRLPLAWDAQRVVLYRLS